MMFGVVNDSCEAIIKVAVGHGNLPKIMVDAVIDTGFTSFLSLPSSIIVSLGLPWSCRDFGTLGDGSEVVFEMYTASIIWDGQVKTIDVVASEAEQGKRIQKNSKKDRQRKKSRVVEEEDEIRLPCML